MRNISYLRKDFTTVEDDEEIHKLVMVAVAQHMNLLTALFREDSQIDFATGNIFLHVFFFLGGGVTQERFSNVSNNRFFQAEKLPGKPCQQGRIISNVTLSQTSRLNYLRVFPYERNKQRNLHW